MKKSDAIKLAVDLMKPLVENGKISFISGTEPGPKDLLHDLEALTKGIMQIEKKL